MLIPLERIQGAIFQMRGERVMQGVAMLSSVLHSPQAA